MKPPLYRLSYSAVLKVAAPLGFEPSRPSSKPGALPTRRRGNALVPRAGFEPASSDLKDRCPRPLDERGDVGAGSENRTRIFCLEGSGSAIELRPRGGWCRDRTCATQWSRRVSTALPLGHANWRSSPKRSKRRGRYSTCDGSAQEKRRAHSWRAVKGPRNARTKCLCKRP